jgi:hypothetical protein
MGSIRNAASKILIIDESEITVDDGCWAPQNWANDKQNVLSNRHDRLSENRMDPNFGRGNVIYVDNHYEFCERKRSFDPKYYDPATK